MTLDDRIREGLEVAAGSVEAARPGSIDAVRRRGSRRRGVKRMGWGAGLVVVLAGVLYVSGLAPGQSSDVYLADGETVISTDPLVVEGTIGPEPQFDTSVLGEEMTLGPVDDVGEILDEVESRDSPTGSWAGGDTFRVTLLGQTREGAPAYVAHSVIDGEPGGEQQRCVWIGNDPSCSGSTIQDVDDYPGGLIPPKVGALPAYTTGGPSTMAWEVSEGASAVMLTVDGERSWTRPVSQVAVFSTNLVGGESVRATVFAGNGEVIAVYQFAAERGEGSPEESFNCPITLPNDPDFSPPEGYPESPGVAQGWFGNAGLWTSLPVDGAYGPRKSVWWSENFEGGNVQIPITVTWQRLDVEADTIFHEGGTNAFTESDGWFMIAGIDPDEAGCWEVTAEYEGTTVRYVYEKQ